MNAGGVEPLVDLPAWQPLYLQMADALVNQGFGVFPQALPAAWAAHLLLEASSSVLRPAGVGRGAGYQHSPKVRQDAIAWIEPTVPIRANWLAWCDGLRMALNRDLMLGLGGFESHFARYQPGDFYAVHRDAFAGSTNRRVSLLAYLNPNWTAAQGGELVLYNTEGGELTRVLPMQGTVVLFLSEQFPHEVLPAQRDRYSIAGWFA